MLFAPCASRLSEPAVARLHRFEEFFRGEVEKEAREVARKQRVLTSALAGLSAIEDQLSAEVPLVFSGEPDLEASVSLFVRSAATRRAGLQESAALSTITAASLAPNPAGSVQAWVTELRRRGGEQRALAEPDAIAKAKAEIAEMENRILLGERVAPVLARIQTLKRTAKLRRASAALTTTGLSKKIGEFTESAVTAQLRTQLLRELENASLDHLPVRMGTRSPRGKTQVSIQLQTSRDVEVRDVLSEGERRAIAIAFFLAEVATQEHTGGIILDDPVSSLDHARRSYVARRLVEEAARRQAIVFTHDIVLLLELQELAEADAVACEMRMVRRVGSDAGHASQDLPWVAMNVARRIGHLKNELQRLGAVERKGDAEEYRRHVKPWFELLREAWERVVEEKLFNGVVGRFQPEIKTMSLSSVNVTAALTSAVERGMTQASKWTHDQAPALNRPPPKAAELVGALDALEVFVAQFGKGNKSAKHP